MKKDFVASIYVIDNKRVLLINHPKLGKWLPPGGHLENGEVPEEGALRELKEETGISAQILSNDTLQVDQENAKSLMRPFVMLLEEIPAWKDQPAHQHIDHVFVGVPSHLPENLGPMECRWFSEEDLGSLIPEVEIFTETVTVAKAAIQFGNI